MNQLGKRAFTLIELLVVVTIIVVLLSLLAPAMEKAIYQAELAVCGTHLRGIATGAVTYTMNNRRAYPLRPGIRALGWYTPRAVRQGQVNGDYDDRPYIKDYISLNGLLNDPLAAKIDIENSRPGSWIWTPYNLWFGFQYNGERGMFRFGDRFTHKVLLPDGTKVRVPFSFLASDMDEKENTPIASHPDSDGLMTGQSAQDADAGAVNKGANSDPDFTVTRTEWSGDNRGKIDNNFAYDDGSVRRINGIAMDEWNDSGSRVVRVGWDNANDRYPGLRTQVSKD